MPRLLKHALDAAALVALFILLSIVAAADPVTLGQSDNFENGTTQGWVVHIDPTAPPHPAPPAVLSGGPAGVGDHYLSLTAVGGGGPGSALSVLNGSQWAGNYIAAGVTAITMDLNNFGPSDLTIRLLIAGPFGAMGPENVAITTNGVFLPANSGWTHVTFLIRPGDMTAGLGSVTAALMNAGELRLFHNPAAAFPPPPIGPPAVVSRLGVDNITATAVPEPGTLLLLSTGLAGVVGAVRRRRKVVG